MNEDARLGASRMTLEEIRELIDLVTETGVAELEVQRGENRVRIRRSLGASAQEIALPAVAAVTQNPAVPPLPSASLSSTPAAGPAPTVDQAAETAEDASLVMVKSPIVGTFYESPSPGTAPFVQIGDSVHPGQVLCIIESMKLMNEIEAEISGVVVSKLVENSQPVEYGEALFALRPL